MRYHVGFVASKEKIHHVQIVSWEEKVEIEKFVIAVRCTESTSALKI